MGQDVTKIIQTLNSRKTPFGVNVEQLFLVLYTIVLPLVVFFWYRDLRRRRFSTTVPAGCIQLGLIGASHTTDEFDKKYDEGLHDQSTWRVKALYIHPIKSCSAIELDLVDVEAEGMTYDRKFAFAELLTPTKADENGERKPKWTFRTLRQPGYEKLALVKPEVWVPKRKDEVGLTSTRRVEREGCLIIRYPNTPTGFLAPLDRLMLRWGLIPKQSSFQVPLEPGENHRYPVEIVNIWKDDPVWINMGEHIPNDFREWLGAKNPVSLFRVDTNNYRPLFRDAPRKEVIGFQPAVGFPDSYPLHLLNMASVHDVGNKVGNAIENLSIRRFRGNIIVEGPPIFDEDDWKRISIGGHELYSCCHTTRCRLPNVDPDTAFRHPVEPDKTLKAYRCIDPGDSKNACLGMQLMPAKDKKFLLRVGDKVTVLERGEHHIA